MLTFFQPVSSAAVTPRSYPPAINSQPPVYPPVPPSYPHPPMLPPGQPYPNYPPQVAPPFAVPPAHVDPHHPLPQPPHPYPQQPYPAPTRYPPQISVVPTQIPVAAPHHVQHVPAYQSAPQVYSSPHGTVSTPAMTPSPGVQVRLPSSFSNSKPRKNYFKNVQTPDNSRPSSARPEAVPTPPTKRKGRSGHSTGYILFASHCHPRVRSEHPDMPFGEISKIVRDRRLCRALRFTSLLIQVGEEWRNLNDEKKREYEEKAKEQTAKAEAEGRLVKKKKKKKDAEDPGPPTPVQPPGEACLLILVKLPFISVTPSVDQCVSFLARTATPQQFPLAPGQYPAAPEQGWTPRMPVGQQPHPGGAPTQFPASGSSYVQTPVGPAYTPQQVCSTLVTPLD